MNDHHPQRVLLADGDAGVRRALALLLGTVLGLQVIAEAVDLTGLSAPGDEHADLLLVDWMSIAANAREVLDGLRALNEQLLIIVLSTRPEDRDAALAAGADAFISKVDSPAQVMKTVRTVLAAE